MLEEEKIGVKKKVPEGKVDKCIVQRIQENNGET